MCRFFFHAHCANLTESVINVLTVNVVWMCDPCIQKFHNMRDSILPHSSQQIATAKSIEEEVMDLKSTVADILQTLSKAIPEASPTNANVHHVRHSTPNSTRAHRRTNTSVADETNAGSSVDLQPSSCDAEGESFSLFLSNIDVTVTEQDIHGLVSHSLCVHEPDRIDVTKLAPKWYNRRTVDFASFRIVLDNKWKSRALDPCSWPINVKIREFINRHNDTWRPVIC